MALITNTFTLTATAAGVLTLTANNSYFNDASSTTPLAPLTNLVKLETHNDGSPETVRGSVVDADGTPVMDLEGLQNSSTVFNEIAIVVSRDALKIISALPSTVDIKAALDAVLTNSIDKIGGRDFINKLIIEDLYKTASTEGSVAQEFSPGAIATTGTVVDPDLTDTTDFFLSAGLIDAPSFVGVSPQMEGEPLTDVPQYASLSKESAVGLLRLVLTLKSDPSIPNLAIYEVDPVKANYSVISEWAPSPLENVYRFGGKFDNRDVSIDNFSELTLSAATTLTVKTGTAFDASQGIKIGQIFTVDSADGAPAFYRVTAVVTGTGGAGTYTVAKLGPDTGVVGNTVTGFVAMPSNTMGGVYDYITALSGFAVKVAAPTLGISSFPLDPATLNLLGQLEEPDPMALDVSLVGSGKVGINLETIKAISDNNLQFTVLNAPANKSLQQLFSIADTAANINALTPDSAKALEAINTNVHPESGDFLGGWEPWELKVTDTANVTLSYETAQTLSNIGWRIALSAKVNVNIEGDFGSITAEELSQLSWAGVDSVGFNTSVLPADAQKVARGQFIVDQRDSWALGKLNVAGLANNSNIDVAFSVDDTPSGEQAFAGIYLPTSIVRKTGVDRIIAQDGVLDISLFDAQKIISSKLKLGNDGDNADTTVYVQSDWELSNLKSRTVASLADAGADRIVYSNDNSQDVDYSFSSARSKNFLDSMAFAVQKGMSIDFSQYRDGDNGEAFYDVSLAVSSLSLRGAGSAFMTVLNNIGTDIALSKTSYSWQNNTNSTLGIKAQASGIKSNWVSISDYSDMEVNGTSMAKASDLATFTKLVTRANAGGVTLADILSADTGVKSGLLDVLGDAFDQNASDIASYLNNLGRQSKGINNLYADLRMSDLSQSADANLAEVFLENASKAGFKGILVDDTTINRYATLITVPDTNFGSTTNGVDINNASSTLDCVYLLDATDYQSSVGLSKYVIDQSGYHFDADGAYFLKEDSDTGFQNRVNLVDKILVTGAADGDFQIDLTALGVGQDNFSEKVSAIAGRVGQFNIAADNGKAVTIEIVGLADNALFTKADIFDLS